MAETTINIGLTIPVVGTRNWGGIMASNLFTIDKEIGNRALLSHRHAASEISGLSWDLLSGKPTTFAPSAHEHVKADITDFAHTHPMSDITGLSLDWSAIQNKPTEYTPATHGHGVSDIIDFPVTWAWGALSGVPTSFKPSAHTHASTDLLGLSAVAYSGLFGDLGGIPESFTPAAHQHPASQVTGLSTVATTGDYNDLRNLPTSIGGISPETQLALDLKENLSNKGVANGYAGLDASGKVPSTQLPALTTSTAYSASSEAIMLALNSHIGDICVRSDLSKSFIQIHEDPSLLSSWQELLSPNSISSVNGYTGAVVLTKTDVGLGSVENAAASALYVPLTRTIAGKPLSANISLSKSDVGLSNVENEAASGLYVPLARKVAGKALSADITLATSDLSNGGSVLLSTNTYADPAWLTSLSGTKISGAVATATNAGNADTLDGQHGSYYQPASTAITSSNIGSQSVSHAATSGDADTLDGQHSNYFQPASTAITTSNIGSQSVSSAASATNADTLDGQHGSYFQPASTAITTSNIGSQSVSYATSAGNSDTVDGWHRDDIRAWGNITGKPTTVSGYGITDMASQTVAAASSSTYVSCPDGGRNAATKLPNSNGHAVRFDFCNGSSANAPSSYAGVMTYAPWDGTTASTGDPSYQLSFGSNAHNGTVPVLSIRNGLDSTWNSWYTLLHSGNYNNYSPTLTGGNASGTWPINITGNCNYANSAGSAPANGGTATYSNRLLPMSGPASYKLGYTADGARTNAGEWGRVVMVYDGNGQTYGVRVDRADYADSAGNSDTCDGQHLGTGAAPTFDTVYTSNWFRTYGETGWYSQSYGGGWYMTDGTWVRCYNGKSIYTPGTIRGDAGFQCLNSGAGITMLDASNGCSYKLYFANGILTAVQV